MDVKQIIYIWLFFVPVWACKMCYNEDQLREVAERKLSRHYLQHPTVSRVTAPPGCPLEQFKKDPLVPHNDRSLSPWRYVLQTDMDYYPSTYAEADCLCSGCIVFKKEKPFETYDYNSVPVVQSKLFLKKESCGNNTYHLKPVSRNVKVQNMQYKISKKNDVLMLPIWMEFNGFLKTIQIFLALKYYKCAGLHVSQQKFWKAARRTAAVTQMKMKQQSQKTSAGQVSGIERVYMISSL
ncbi:interleukin-17C [Scomber scombrus]|uniref:Interleukin-17C n=1 Tax=Scomber scombrus TaxID=13677 RepID=A0AAV1P3C7_SCOSC